MKRILIIGGMVLAVAVTSLHLQAAAGLKLAQGEVEVLYEFINPVPAGMVTPEGIALDRKGNIYVSLRTTDGISYIKNEIVKFTPKGDISVLADLGPAAPGGFGVIGLTTDADGNVYVAFPSFNAAHGVWKVYPDGSAEHLNGSWQLLIPNSLNFDNEGNLFVTDWDPFKVTAAGIWKYGADTMVFEPWCVDPLIMALDDDPFGQPIGGANGIAFHPPDNIYVSNTEQGTIVRVPVLEDGTAGVASVINLDPFPIMNPDGVTVDAHGNVYTVIPVSTWRDFPPAPPPWLLSPIVKIYPDTGMVEPILDPVLFDDPLYFDFPTTLAFGTGPLDKKSVFVISMGAEFFFGPPGTGPKLTQVGVGVPGRTGQ
ncbi:MAG: SMP-30/gluconolactonase/LRE family protein [Puniceicoccaceae bacterium]